MPTICPTGLGVEDIVLAEMLACRACEQGVGTHLRLWEGEAWI